MESKQQIMKFLEKNQKTLVSYFSSSYKYKVLENNETLEDAKNYIKNDVKLEFDYSMNAKKDISNLKKILKCIEE